MNQAEKKQDSKPEIQEVKCLPSCIYRGTPMCKKCVDGSKYEWDYTEING